MAAIKWISSSEKKWNCRHVFECDILLDQDGFVRVYNMQHGEPKGKYRYAFLTDVLKGVSINYRSRDMCNCPAEEQKKSDYEYIMVIHMKNNEVLKEPVRLDQIDPIKAMLSRNTYMELPKQSKIITMANVLYIEFKIA
jgi:hypothetical protein